MTADTGYGSAWPFARCAQHPALPRLARGCHDDRWRALQVELEAQRPPRPANCSHAPSANVFYGTCPHAPERAHVGLQPG